MSIAISFESVTKSYRVLKTRPFLAGEFFRRILLRPSERTIHTAIANLKLEIKQGESIGVIGSNGAGKSTFLSLIAQTTYPSSGHITVNGRIGPLLELGAGFHPDLTGYENLYLNASLLGFSREEVEEKKDSIIEFSGIRDFIHAPIQTYSTGMITRLGFAILAHMDPDILLIDEIFAVGDAEFQDKCFTTMKRFKDAGKTFILVSHSMETILELCDRAIWLQDGRIRMTGPPASVCHYYLHPDEAPEPDED